MKEKARATEKTRCKTQQVQFATSKCEFSSMKSIAVQIMAMKIMATSMLLLAMLTTACASDSAGNSTGNGNPAGSSSGSAASGNEGGNEGGGGSDATPDSSDSPDNTPPAVVADLAGTVSSLTNIALTWTEPTDEDFSHLLIRWQPAGPMGSTQQPLRVNKGTQTATITGLAQATSYSFTAESVDATGNQSVASTASAASMVMTELRPILALFSAGQEDGDFGLGSSGRCQTRLDDSTYAIGAELKSRGYTKAVFFGSTPTYDFIDLATDPDALGISGQTPAALAARGVSLFSLASTSAVTETTMFEDATSGLERTRTVGQLVNVVTATGAWQTGGADIIAATVGSSGIFWSFTANATYGGANNSCSAATVSGSTRGISGNAIATDAVAESGDAGISCSNTTPHVLCLAH